MVDSGTDGGLAAGSSEEQVRFVADARLVSVLGEQLIGSEKVGILELVKNAYDAGAHNCAVTLEGVPGLSPATRSLLQYGRLTGPIIEVRDDGSGMTHDELIHGWLRPATPSRAHLKERLRAERDIAQRRGTFESYSALVEQLKEAHGGRLPLGEKGIGRLATHRLGQHLWLRTKTADDSMEWELKIDWGVFDSLGDAPVDLDSIHLTLRHQPPTTTYGARGSGTVICCHGGRPGYEWTEQQIIDLGRSINALRSPRKGPASFMPTFVSPHVPESALASPLERTPAPFELVAIVEEDGKAEIELTFNPPALLRESLKPFKREDSVDLRSVELKTWKTGNGTALRRPACGPFLLHVKAWLRHREWLGPDYDQITDYLDHFGGITIYRDGLATLPAQQSAKADWLGLAAAQIKKVGRISYYHLAGEIEIQQERTLDLRDRTSREGMIETQSYRDLVALTRAAIEQLQFHMQRVRKEWSKTSDTARLSPSTLRARAAMVAKVVQKFVEHYDFSKDTLELGKVAGGKNAPQRISEAAQTLASLGDQLKLQEDEREGLLEAAGFGLAIGVAVHEIGKLASAMLTDVRQVRPAVDIASPAGTALQDLGSRAEALLAETRRLAPLRVTRAEATRPVAIRAVVEAAHNAFLYTLQESQVLFQVDGDDFQVAGRFGALAQVFANLIDNSIYWIGTGGTGGVIQVVVSGKTRTVLVADSGPGVSEKMKPHLFEPFYSEKSPPSGLGLYICSHYLSQCGATIRLARTTERSNFRGAQFLLDFARSSAEGSES